MNMEKRIGKLPTRSGVPPVPPTMARRDFSTCRKEAYLALLRTLPTFEDAPNGHCKTCLEQGLCDVRADTLVSEILDWVHDNVGPTIEIEPDALLAWLLKHDEIGTRCKEDVAELARKYCSLALE